MLERRLVVGLHRVLERADDLGIPLVVLTIASPPIFAAVLQGRWRDGHIRKCALVARERLRRDHVHTDATDSRRRVREVAINDGAVDAEALEDLRAAVRLDGGDAHARDGLAQSFDERLDVQLFGALRVDGGRHQLASRDVGDRFESEVGIDRFSAVPDQQRQVHHLARFSRFDDQTHSRARLLANQVVVHRGSGQQRRDGHVRGIDVPVTEDQHGCAGLDLLRGEAADPLESGHEPGRTGVTVKDHRNGLRRKLALRDVPELLEVVVGEHGVWHLEPLRLRGTLFEEVSAGTQRGHQRHHRLLANGIDRRVGHLREELLEVVEQRQRPLAQHGKRRVVAHRSDRFLTGLAHRLQQDLDVLDAVTECLLAHQQRARVRGRHVVGGLELVEVHRACPNPLAIRLRRAERALDGGVIEDPARRSVDEEEPPGFEAPLPGDTLLGHIEHARLGGHDHEPVLGHEVSRGTQAVAVERRTDDASVGEGDCRRTVPGLEQRPVKLVEGTPLIVHERVLMPRLRDHHHHRMLDRPAGHGEQFQGIVELRGVGSRLVEHRHQLRDVIPEVRTAELRLARAHPVDVAAQRVDLTVVR